MFEKSASGKVLYLIYLNIYLYILIYLIMFCQKHFIEPFLLSSHHQCKIRCLLYKYIIEDELPIDHCNAGILLFISNGSLE